MFHPHPDAPFAVVYEDETVLVLDKRSGLLSVPGRGPDKQDCLATRVQASYPSALVVHRLDMATSGLIAMARSRPVQRTLSKAFAAREVKKRYVAVVSGSPNASSPAWGTIDLPLVVDWPNRPLRIVDPVRGKPSVTRWRVLGPRPAGGTRVELEPVTGRSHQLRVHLREIGYPILGDALYAPPEVQAQASRLLLHACTLSFAHPVTGVWMTFDAPEPF